MDAGGDADVGVTEEFLDGDEGDAPFREEEGGGRGGCGHVLRRCLLGAPSRVGQ